MNIPKINNINYKQNIQNYNKQKINAPLDEGYYFDNKPDISQITYPHIVNSAQVKLQKAFLNTKDIKDNVEFAQSIYPSITEFLGVNDIAPDTIKFVKGNDGGVGLFNEPSGEVIFCKDKFSSMQKGEIVGVIAHELTHLKQFTLLYKYLGKDKFKEKMSNDIPILKDYARNNNLNANSYNDVDKIVNLINLDIETSEVYNNIKNFNLSNRGKQKAVIYLEAFDCYTNPRKNYEKYKNNLLEKEAFVQENLMVKRYENFKKSVS